MAIGDGRLNHLSSLHDKPQPSTQLCELQLLDHFAFGTTLYISNKAYLSITLFFQNLKSLCIMDLMHLSIKLSNGYLNVARMIATDVILAG